MLQSSSFALCCCCCYFCCCCCPCHKTLTTTKLQENYPLMSNIYGRDGSSQAGKTLPPPEVEAALSGCSNCISGEILTAPRYIYLYIYCVYIAGHNWRNYYGPCAYYLLTCKHLRSLSNSVYLSSSRPQLLSVLMPRTRTL